MLLQFFSALNVSDPRYSWRVTVLEAIQRSTEFLTKKNVESPRLQAELLLAHTLQLPRMRLYLSFERALDGAEEETMRQLVKRRGAREPLQHIVGSACFCGLDIGVSKDVLVPRPETELLAEAAWTFLKSRHSAVSTSPVSEGLAPEAAKVSALDFGTGSGCLAIAIAVNCPPARVTGLDISERALAVARQNAARHKVDERVELVLGDGLGTVPSGAQFDLVAANPPYIPSAEISDLEPEVREYDPHVALNGGPDGLDFYRQLATQAASRLKPDGKIMIEFGDGQHSAIEKIFRGENWIVEEILNDYTHRPRILIARVST